MTLNDLAPNWDLLTKPWNWVFVALVLILTLSIMHVFMRKTVINQNGTQYGTQ
jgi:hypothetical protein